MKLSVFLCVTALSTLTLQAKDRKIKQAPKDQIEVVGHLAAAGGPVRNFVTTQHFSSFYLYAQRESGNIVTLIDVTHPESPAALAEVASPSNSSLAAVAGTAALVASGPVTGAVAAGEQTIRVMDLSDPKNPRVAREFTGVTAMSKDERRGLIYVANAEGIWILRQHLAEDPNVEKAYADYVIYGPSMYPPK